MGVILVGGVIAVAVLGVAAVIVIKGADPKRGAPRGERAREKADGPSQ